MFVGVDRSSSILIFSVDEAGAEPRLELQSIFRDGGTKKTFNELLDERNLGNLDPEDLRYESIFLHKDLLVTVSGGKRGKSGGGKVKKKQKRRTIRTKAILGPCHFLGSQKAVKMMTRLKTLIDALLR